MLPGEVIQRARNKGLDRLIITDHNTIKGALAAKELAPDLVVVGEEILVEGGQEFLAFFVKEHVPPGLPHLEALARLQAQGAVVSVSHPFDRHRNRPWAEDQLGALLSHLDAIEGLNARTMSRADNEHARTFAMAHSFPMTAGSDAHTKREVGAVYMDMPPFASADEFRQGLSSAVICGDPSPLWVHLLSKANKLRGFFGLKPTLS